MRHNLRRVTQVLALLLLTAVIAVGFQNCGTYTAIAPFNNPSIASCVGTECGIAKESISLMPGNQTILMSRPTTGVRDCNSSSADPAWCIDVAGFCDAGGFPDNRIYVQLKTGPTPVAEYPTPSRCDENGRFRVSVLLPNNYDFNQFYEIEVRVEGVDQNGSAVRNPLPIDYASIGLVPGY